MTNWVRAMDRIVTDLVNRPGPIDWPATLGLYDRWSRRCNGDGRSVTSIAVGPMPTSCGLITPMLHGTRFVTRSRWCSMAAASPSVGRAERWQDGGGLFTVATTTILRRAAMAAASASNGMLRQVWMAVANSRGY